MLTKGDIVLITDPGHEWAGFTGIIKKIIPKNARAIVKISTNKKTAWISQSHLIKITKKQQEVFVDLLKELS
jgi:hypothetical protein